MISFIKRISPRERGSILFCTTGMLLQFMQSDPALKGFSHIILDEIHERSTESDFIITLLKQIIPVVCTVNITSVYLFLKDIISK